VDFTSTDDIHTMGHLYESMLREMSDAAGDSGEFYTPRPLVRFIVQQVDPRLGDAILDPAAGTGGFLVEALSHVRPQARTSQQWRKLQQDLRGIEKKPLPYLLGMMNLLLHEVQQPSLRRDNALAVPLNQIGVTAKVDVIVTNPPFGGEEEQAIQGNFPAGTRTAETALLFLQVIERSLRPGGRCGMILPNGVLYGDGVAARIRQRLMTECEVHTIVRLPPGAFAPYTPIPTNLVFFDKTGPTREVWFYDQPLPEGRKNYSKTRPLQFEEFAACQAWWGGRDRVGRVGTDRAWRVPIAEIEASGFNLDRKNPNRANDPTHRPPAELVEELVGMEAEIQGLLGEIQRELSEGLRGNSLVSLEEILELAIDEVAVEPETTYRVAGIFSFGRGLFERPSISGSETKYPRLHRLHEGQLVYSRLKVWEGAISVVEAAFDGAYVSPEYPTFNVRSECATRDFVSWLSRWPTFWDQLLGQSQGVGARRERVPVDRLLATTVPLPSLEQQRRIVERMDRADRVRRRALDAAKISDALVLSTFAASLAR
jgi:type I restriction enzyme M protein